MEALKAVVKNGRLVLDEPTELPEGTELRLVVDDGVALDDMDPEERAALLKSIGESFEDVKAERVHNLKTVLEELRSRR